MGRVKLVTNWDVHNKPPTEKRGGQFVGRTVEVASLANELIRRDEGSILVCGHRGVGKTALVYEAIQLAKDALEKSDSKQPIISVLINASRLTLDLASSDSSANSHLIRMIITRLYATSISSVIPDDCKESINALFLKASAKGYETSIKGSHARKNETSTELIGFIKFNTNGKELIAWVSAVVMSIAAQIGLNGKLSAFISAAVFALPMLARIEFSKSKKTRDELGNSIESAFAYQHDASPDIVEFDLDATHRLLSKNKAKVVYVFDEMDKIRPDDAAKILKSSKNLFTLASATFIFVGAESLYDRVSKNKPDYEGEWRSSDDTLFSSKYFIQRPAAIDLTAYIRGISLDRNSLSDLEIQYLISRSQGDHFALVREIRDHVVGYDGANPEVEIELANTSDVLQAKMQQLLSLVFETQYRYRKASLIKENEKTLRRMYDYVGRLVSEVDAETPPPQASTDGDAAVRDLASAMARYNLVTISRPANSQQGASYRMAGQPGDVIPDDLESYSELETEFLAEVERIAGLLEQFLNAYFNVQRIQKRVSSADLLLPKQTAELNNVTGQFGPMWLGVRNFYEAVKEQPASKRPTREQLIEQGKNLEALTRAFETSSTATVAAIVSSNVGGQGFNIQHASNHSIQIELNSRIPGLGSLISQTEHLVVFHVIAGNIGIFVGDKGDQVLSGFDRSIQSTDSLRVFECRGTDIAEFPKSRSLIFDPDTSLATKIDAVRKWLGTPRNDLR